MGFLIIDINGPVLSAEERTLIQHPYIAGVVLFTRNYKNPTQLHELTASVKKANPALFVAVDQEGGRVQRFLNDFTKIPPMRHFGRLYEEAPERAKESLKACVTTMAQELKQAGVTVNFTPVLDIDYGKSEIIGERSLSDNPETVTLLGEVIIDTLHAHGLTATGKHFPGHGGVVLDSHKTLPIESRDRATLSNNDLLPFIRLANKLDAIMPAHVVYSALDDSNPAGFSRACLQDVLRHELSFEGVIISDDLSMMGAAVLGNHTDRVKGALTAGCDLLLICHNHLAVMDLLIDRFSYPSHLDHINNRFSLLE